MNKKTVQQGIRRLGGMTIACLAVAAFLALSSCEKNYLPKPLGYNRLELPKQDYQLSPDTLPYRFEYSTHAKLLSDTSSISERFWVEISYPEIMASIHLTYKEIHDSEQLLKELMDDSYTLTAKHQIKAYAIDEVVVRTPSGQTAIVAEIDGEVPSQMQFTMTDSASNFLRGALYFNTKVNNDSLKPAIEYVKKDLMHLINTVEWTR